MTEPTIAAKEPVAVDVEEGRTYWWCRCGKSAKQPFCDGSHKDTSFEPMEYKATSSRTLFFCQCKHTKREPLCDGSHSKL